jgi:hypothetical protein
MLLGRMTPDTLADMTRDEVKAMCDRMQHKANEVTLEMVGLMEHWLNYLIEEHADMFGVE